jgi:RNA polymerase sigma factor (sigma-70 family)
MTDSRTLLAEYAAHGSESAFRELLESYIDLVYSTAVRMTDGDTHRAEDITQTVFTDLARLAGTFSPAVMLGGWLHRRTCHVAATVMRSERRRQKRERLAAEMNALYENAEAEFELMAPLLDEAINRLNARDRTAIVLRFFEHRDLRAVGAALGINADAAQKCVSRAVDKLRAHFARRGIVASSALIASTVAANAVQAAPTGLAASIFTKSLAAAASGAGASGLLPAIKLLLANKTLCTVSAVVIVGAVVSIPVITHQRSVATENLRRGLVLHYTFDQAEPNGKVTDTSGRGNDGVAKGVRWITNGKHGGAYEFTADGDRIDVANSDSLNPKEITLAAWVRTTRQDAKWYRVFDKSYKGGYALSIAGVEYYSWQGQAFAEIGPRPFFVASDRVVADGQWHHLVSTYDGQELRLYVDGQLQQGVVCWTGAVLSNQFNLTIGCNGSYPPEQVGLSFIGTIDEPMIWARALSPKEVTFLYESQR